MSRLNRFKAWRKRRELLADLERYPEIRAGMSAQRARVISILDKDPEASLKEIGAVIGISGPAVRGHIEATRFLVDRLKEDKLNLDLSSRWVVLVIDTDTGLPAVLDDGRSFATRTEADDFAMYRLGSGRYVLEEIYWD